MSSSKLEPDANVRTEYAQLRTELQQLYAKLAALDADKSEHQLVVNQLKDLPSDRRAWMQVGGSLCQQTVGDVLPVLQSNMNSASESIAKLTEQLEKVEARLNELSSKYTLEMAQGPAGSAPGASSGQTGLLA
mmetsp:Transcript_3373/g.5915  ORF Transcript_3373/g.5915 Transcript_3373/m.5915 type:complete len:133 (-) Transcript_3373:158-556(-)